MATHQIISDFAANLTSGTSTSKTTSILPPSGSLLHTHHASQPSPSSSSQQDKTLTVDQLNAILSRVRVDELALQQHQRQQHYQHQSGSESDFQTVIASSPGAASSSLDQSTHYVNPIVQFESHFKNWPQVSSRANAFTADENGQQQQESTSNVNYRHESTIVNPAEQQWCKFKPIPPFIVNNKPFSDIQCSVEQEYFMSTGRQQQQQQQQSSTGGIRSSAQGATAILADETSQRHGRHRRNQAADNKIYLMKSTHAQATQVDQRDEPFHNERCSIQCKVDVLYQVNSQARSANNKQSGNNFVIGGRQSAASNIYYLPLKFCLFVLNNGDKAKTFGYYLICRSIADASLLLAFILIDILLLIESIETKQFQLEGNKGRLFGLLLAITLIPLLVAALFDLAATWLQASSQDALGSLNSRGYRDGYLVSLVNERLIPQLGEKISQLYVFFGAGSGDNGKQSRLSASVSFSSDEPRLRVSNLAPPQPPSYDEQSYRSPDSKNHTKRHPLLSDQALVVDNYLVPFFIYAIFMFALAINAFRLPLVSLKTPISRISSSEELGLVQQQQQDRRQLGDSNLLCGDKTIGSDKIRSNSSLASGSGKLAADSSKSTRCRSTRLQNLTNFRTRRAEAKKIGQSRKKDAYQAEVANSNAALQAFSRSSANNSQFIAKKVAIFAILTLFMGLQFNLIQIAQTQILLESFNVQNDFTNQQQQQQQQLGSHQSVHDVNGHRPGLVAIWFVLVPNSSGTLFILLLAVLFSDELSVFLAKFSPFKPMPSITSSSLSVSQANELRFRKYLAISLVIYAMRYFILANMSQSSKLKWFLIVLFQVTELLNFPLVWFVLASRAHELLGEVEYDHKTLRRDSLSRDRGHVATSGRSGQSSHKMGSNIESQPNSSPTIVSDTSLRLFSIHILVQSSLAFIYFALARFLALFVFSFHASLYLHSNNVDWFISTFYNGQHSTAGTGGISVKAAASTNRTGPLNGTSPSPSVGPTIIASQPEALFAPLPSERQTYLHAARSLVKHNSFICLLLGTLFVTKFAHLRYKQWRQVRERQRAVDEELIKRAQTPQSERDSDLIDERLSLDLKLISSGQTSRQSNSMAQQSVSASQGLTAPTRLTHVPKATTTSRGGPSGVDDGVEHEDKPRARIHFRYDLGLHKNSSTTSSASSASSLPTMNLPSLSSPAQVLHDQVVEQRNGDEQRKPEHRSTNRCSPAKPVEFRIPIAIEDEEELQQRGPVRGRGRPHQSGWEREKDGSQSVGRNVMHIERVLRTQTKRVKIVDDGENWSLGSGSSRAEQSASRATKSELVQRLPQWTSLDTMATSPPPPGFGDDERHDVGVGVGFGADTGRAEQSHRVSPREFDEHEQQHLMGLLERRKNPTGQQVKVPPEFAASTTNVERNKRITFAPTTTLIDQDGGRSRGQFGIQLHQPIASGQLKGSGEQTDNEARRQQHQRHRMASPELSIDGDSEDNFE